MITRKITSLFNNLLLTTGLGLMAFNCVNNRKPDKEGRELTMGEIKAMEDFWGCSVDPDHWRIAKKSIGEMPSGTAGTASINSMKINMREDYYSEDYSAEMDDFKVTVFYHETTHLRDGQNIENFAAARCTNGEPNDGDQYTPLSGISSFSALCTEQRATIAAAYAVTFLHPIKCDRYFSWNYWPQTQENLNKLASIIELHTPQAAGARLNYSDANYGRYTGETREDRQMRKFYEGPNKCLGVGPWGN